MSFGEKAFYYRCSAVGNLGVYTIQLFQNYCEYYSKEYCGNCKLFYILRSILIKITISLTGF